MGIETANEMRAVEDAQGVIEVFTDNDIALGKTNPEVRRFYLKDEVMPRDGVVMIDDSVFFDTEDKVQVLTVVGSKSRTVGLRGTG